MNKQEQLIKFLAKYNTMTAEEQQYMETGFIEILATRIGLSMILMLVIGILIGYYLL